MKAIVETASGAVVRVCPDPDGHDLTGCTVMDVPEDYDPIAISHLVADGAWAVNLGPRKSRLVAAVNDRAEAVRCLFLTPGSGQAITYARKEDEARAWTAEADAAAFPFLSAEATATGATLADTAALVLAQANAWVTIGAAIEGNRRGLVVTIEAATDLAELEAINIGAGWPA